MYCKELIFFLYKERDLSNYLTREILSYKNNLSSEQVNTVQCIVDEISAFF